MEKIKLTMGKLLKMEEDYNINIFDPNFFSSLSSIEKEKNNFIEERVEPFRKAIGNKKELNQKEQEKIVELNYKINIFDKRIKQANSAIYYKILSAYYDKDFIDDETINYEYLEEFYQNFIKEVSKKFTPAKNNKNNKDNEDVGK